MSNPITINKVTKNENYFKKCVESDYEKEYKAFKDDDTTKQLPLVMETKKGNIGEENQKNSSESKLSSKVDLNKNETNGEKILKKKKKGKSKKIKTPNDNNDELTDDTQKKDKDICKEKDCKFVKSKIKIQFKVEIIEIENYKKYNYFEGYLETQAETVSSCSLCVIF